MVQENVFLFYPNLIGYGRILLALISFIAMPKCPLTACFCYFSSAFLDAFDGFLARKFNQGKKFFKIYVNFILGTRFGAMLDQLTDRCTFMALLMTLCMLYPLLTFFFQLVAIIDIASHWLHLHATDLTGKNTHKSSANPILHFYYTSRLHFY